MMMMIRIIKIMMIAIMLGMKMGLEDHVFLREESHLSHNLVIKKEVRN